MHKNLRLAVISGENFTGILDDPANTLFRSLLRADCPVSTDAAPNSRAMASLWRLPRINSLPRPRRHSGASVTTCPRSSISRIRCGFASRAPYAHYVVEGSADGKTWSLLADRRHGPWRGMQTDFFSRPRASPAFACAAPSPMGARSTSRTFEFFAAADANRACYSGLAPAD